MKRMMIVASLLLVAGCTTVTVLPSPEPGVHRLRHDAAVILQMNAPIELGAKANELCPRGWQQVRQQYAAGTAIWDIRCDPIR